MLPLDRWIPLLGLAALLLAGVGSHPKIHPADEPPALHVALIVGTVAAGIASLLSRRLQARVVPIPAFAALGIYLVQLVYVSLRDLSSTNALLLVGTAGYLLQYIGTPLLWGLALSRREDPAQERTQRYGRMAAGIVQLSFVFLFVTQVQELLQFSRADMASDSLYATLGALSRVVWAAESVSLIWASILCMRTTGDPLKIQDWAARIHRLTFASFGAGILSTALSIAAHFGENVNSRDPFPLVLAWRPVLVAVLTLLAAFTLPPCFRSSPPDCNSSATAG